ncbi:MAG TPA: ABC transporter permease [Streptosporangiaceae bacterium]
MTALAGTGPLARLAARRDRIMLPAWLYVLTALVASTAYSFKKLYPAAGSRQEFASAAAHNPALLSLYGTLSGSSVGSLTAWRYGTFAALGAGLMSIFLVIRHTRGDEEAGRLELAGSAAVGRYAPLGAGLLTAAIANFALGALITAGLAVQGLPAAGCAALAAGIAGSGLVFAAAAAVTAQLADTARTARGIAVGLLLAAYLLRAAGDSAGASGPGWLTWLSPVGWTELIRPFGAARWWVTALPLAAALALAGLAALAAARRDYGAGLITLRRGPARAAPSLRSPLALAWRLQRGQLVGWLAGALVYGALIGSAAKGIGGLLGSQQIRQIVVKLGGTAAVTNAYLATIMSFTGLIAAGYAISVVLRLRAEETAQRADPVLACGVSRVRWGSSHLAIAAGGTIVILAVTGFGAGLGYLLRSPGGASQLGVLTGAGLAQAPAALVLAGVAAALAGLAPRACVPGGWLALGAVVTLLFLGGLASVPHWLLDISPFTHVPKLPGGTVTAAPLAWLCLIALALAAAGLAGLRRRDIG